MFPDFNGKTSLRKVFGVPVDKKDGTPGKKARRRAAVARRAAARKSGAAAAWRAPSEV